MRSTADRIRHVVSFEIIGLLLVIPLALYGFNMKVGDIGVVAIAISLIATLWNYIFNILFDRASKRLRGTVHKTLPLRVLHSFLFEVGLLIVTLPLIALYLRISLWQALVLDISLIVFYVIYAFVFNYLYDKIFPLPKNA
ncbi:PACE efflux transporter [Pacificibacter maritimus]|nr:PACE efflux transporter [Pacificibacter maritimus]